jgi:ParB family transcriptional regulator, chromosome partitioning protein
MSKPALGRGLGALLNSGGKPPTGASSTPPGAVPPLAPGKSSAVTRVPWSKVRPSPWQPRKDFTPESLQELADSIREQGIVQPLIVRPIDDYYELIAGERRWRAAQIAGLTEVPILERAASNREVLELALIENLQRENLNPIEEALGYAQLQQLFELTQEQVAQKVGRARTAIANALRLLKLPEVIQTALRDGRISVGHAKVILGVSPESSQAAVAEQVIRGHLSVRQTEELVARLQSPAAATPPPTATPIGVNLRDPHIVDLEGRLRERFLAKVALRYTKGRGSIEVRFHSDAELEQLLDRLGVTVD